MANIAISDLRPAGAELFNDSENYLNELSDYELSQTYGGSSGFCLTGGIAIGITIGIYGNKRGWW